MGLLIWARDNACSWNKSIPIEAAKNGHLTILRYARENGCIWGKGVAIAAAEAGNLDVLQWTLGNGCYAIIDVWNTAAEKGHLHLLKYGKEAGFIKDLEESGLCLRAASGGHEDVILWLMPDPTVSICWQSMTFLVARSGRLDLLQKYSNKIPDTSLFSISNMASASGHVEIIDWIYARNSSSVRMGITTNAAANGHLNVLKWAANHAIPFDPDCAKLALDKLDILQFLFEQDPQQIASVCQSSKPFVTKNFEVLKWLVEKGGQLTTYSFSWAAKSGNIEMINWLHEQKCPADSDTCAYAASAGDLEMVKWLRAHEYPWDPQTCSEAASSGNLELLKWVYASGCGWTDVALSEAARNGHLHILEWAYEHHLISTSEDVSESAATPGHLEVLKWLQAHGFPLSKRILRRAASSEHWDVVIWMIKDGAGFDLATYNQGKRCSDPRIFEIVEAWRVKTGGSNELL